MGKMEPETALPKIQREGNPELLTTKLAPPRLHSRSVPRPELLARLDAGIERKLTLISTPAGFGKTTLVSEWIAYRRNQPEKLPIAWVSLDSWDNDLVRFWRYVLTACKTFHHEVSNSALDLLDSSPPPSIQAMLTLFINELAKLPSQAVLVLEDYHTITAPQVHESLTFFIDHLPSTLHLILITRSNPPLTLARLRAGNELYELRADDLRFSLEEVQAFLTSATIHIATRYVSALPGTEGGQGCIRLMALQDR
jgi:LuxR family maltose regulon positive regulatory protein